MILCESCSGYFGSAWNILLGTSTKYYRGIEVNPPALGQVQFFGILHKPNHHPDATPTGLLRAAPLPGACLAGLFREHKAASIAMPVVNYYGPFGLQRRPFLFKNCGCLTRAPCFIKRASSYRDKAKTATVKILGNSPLKRPSHGDGGGLAFEMK
jgi:hypothetical protein